MRRMVTVALAAFGTFGLVVITDLGASVAYAAFAPLAGTHAARAMPARPAVGREGDLAPAKLYVFGDSLAFGYQASPGRGWIDEFRRRLQRRRPGSVVLNSAVCGARLRDIDRQLAEAPAGNADAVLVVAGANDVIFPTNPLSVALWERALLGQIQRRYPQARVIVANVPDLSWRSFHVTATGPQKRLPVPLRFASSWLTNVDNAVIGVTATRYGDQVLDLHRSIAAHIDRAYVSVDGLHPNDRGYAMLANYAWPAIARATRVTE